MVSARLESSRRAPWRALALLTFAALFVLALAHHWSPLYDRTPGAQTAPALLLAYLFVVTAASVGFALIGRDQGDLFSPWVVFPVVYALIFGVGSIRWLAEQRDGAVTLVAYAAIGLTAYLLGTIWSQPLRAGLSGTTWSAHRVRAAVLLLAGIGLAGAVVFYTRAGVPALLEDALVDRMEAQDRGSNRMLYLARLVAPCWIVYLTYSLTSAATRRTRLLMLPLFAVALVVMLGTANRSDWFFLLFMTLVVYSCARRSEQSLRRRAALVAGSLLLGGFVFAYGYYRLVSSDPRREAYLQSVGQTWGLPDSGYEGLVVYVVLQIGVYSENVLRVFEYIPDSRPFLHGRTFLTTLATALPGKQDDIGTILKQEMGLTFRGGGINVTMLGELYQDFGLPWIVLMMGVYGWVAGALYKGMRRDRSPSAVLLYAYCVFCLVLSTVGGLFSQLSRWYYLAVFASVVAFVSRPGRRAVSD